MTVTFPEIITGTAAPSTGTNFPVTTSLVASDLVVVTWGRGTTGAATLSGLGGTWTAAFDATSGKRVMLRFTSGVTGSGTVTLNPGAGDTANVVIYVIRGLTSPTTYALQQSTWSTATTPANTDEMTPSQSFGMDQVAVLIGTCTAGTVTFPSNPVPALGWTVDMALSTDADFYAAHLIGTDAGTTQGGIRSTSTNTLGVAMFVFGTATTAPPLTSTFIGWGSPIF